MNRFVDGSNFSISIHLILVESCLNAPTQEDDSVPSYEMLKQQNKKARYGMFCSWTFVRYEEK